MFEPIAIVGRSCVLPGAVTPTALWDNVVNKRDLITKPPKGEWIGDSPLEGAATGPEIVDMGGYVTGFEDVFDPTGFEIEPNKAEALDPAFQWVLHCSREALRHCEATHATTRDKKVAIILGQLGYPTRGLTEAACFEWMSGIEGFDPDTAGVAGANPEDRFSSGGYTAQLAANALGLSGPAFTLDAACASSLYALKLACDHLQFGMSDIVLAGGVNCADRLLLHSGFTVLSAISPSGQSRPFHKDADGLLPAQGAAILALKRLPDAQSAGDQILGVIRGVGLANDGRGRGPLAPSEDGQVRAMRRAYEVAGVSPSSIGLIECHATGTEVGDVQEIRSMHQVFGPSGDFAVGSLKSNLGHLIATAGAASLIKVLGAFEAKVLPPTLHAEDPTAALADTPFRPLTDPEPWTAEGPRRAGISNFGFGGNNAHLIVEEWKGGEALPRSAAPKERKAVELAICGLGIVTGAARGVREAARQFFGDENPAAFQAIEEAVLPAVGLRIPPNDLRQSLGQQTLILEAAFEAVSQARDLNPDRTGVIIGMECDAEGARWGLRARLEHLLRAGGLDPDLSWLETAKEAATPPLNAAQVVGHMPNVPANRINAQFDYKGFGYTVSSGELSGLTAIRLAANALGLGEIDSAVVGASDLSVETIHMAASQKVLPPSRQEMSDGAVVLVLKRLEDAKRSDDRIWAVLSVDEEDIEADHHHHSVEFHRSAETEAGRRFGHAHATSGLFHLVASVLGVSAGALPGPEGPRPWFESIDRRSAKVIVESHAGHFESVVVKGPPCVCHASTTGGGNALVRLFAGDDRTGLCMALKADESTGGGPYRLGMVASDPDAMAASINRCVAQLEAGEDPRGPGIFFSKTPVQGELAFVFAGANAYEDMAQDLFLAFPRLTDRLLKQFSAAKDIGIELYAEHGSPLIGEAFGELKSSSLVCQAHSELLRGLFGIEPQAAFGLSSGETNTLFAFDAWRDSQELFDAIDRSGIYRNHLSERFHSARQTWGLDHREEVEWQSWRIIAQVEKVKACVGAIERVSITIILSAEDCLIGGDPAACAKVIEAIGRDHAVEVTPSVLCHTPDLLPAAATWRDIHDRETHPVEGVRLYTNATNSAYTPTRESAREALTAQALKGIDFPKTVESAWRDGVRIFIEVGPRDILSRAVGQTLAGREHVALSLDAPGRGQVEQIALVVAQLFVLGVALNAAAVEAAFRASVNHDHTATVGSNGTLRLPVRQPKFEVSAVRQASSGREKEVNIRPKNNGERSDPRWAQNDQETAPSSRSGLIMTQQAKDMPWNPPTAFDPGDANGAPNLNCTIDDKTAGLTSPLPCNGAADHQPSRISRAELEILASGKISEIFGPSFEGQDHYRRQVRMPAPPLLLADRVVEIQAPPGVLGQGYLCTETDVSEGAWYLSNGRMSLGPLMESGQADLLLISWMGIDAHNKGERVYRLLGCEVTFHEGGIPAAGDTLHFKIQVNQHARIGDIRMFFFEYDCTIDDRLVASVRNGQAGFFSDEELRNAKGIAWDAKADEPRPDAGFDPPQAPSAKRRFSADEVKAFVDGRAFACFGAGFEMLAAHQRTPNTPAGRMQLIDEVPEFDPFGGPWGRGYLRASFRVPKDMWFYDGHFRNDPCMPGTLMADAGTQALAFHMAAIGLTRDHDAWRFEPVTGEPFAFICRGQVVPDREHVLTYEIFVEEVIEGPIPTVYAAVLCSNANLKIFHCRRFGLRLVPDWPLSTRQHLLPSEEPARIVGPRGDVRGDGQAMLACAWGSPTQAFGQMYEPLEKGHASVQRLPGPPYQFLSRVVSVDCPPAEATTGGAVEVEYHVPADAWYFCDNAREVMPFAVLLEVVLQPCGWLACYMGFACQGNLRFRNLDGQDAVVHKEVTPETSTLSTRATLTKFTQLAGTTLVFFHCECWAGDELIMELDTGFGFFPLAALENQRGLPTTPEQLSEVRKPVAPLVDLKRKPGDLLGKELRLPGGKLLMIDEVIEYCPTKGDAPGRIRCRQHVDPESWYFKAHFFGDPVQPGSLGLEALLQALQCYLLLEDRAEGKIAPRFEPIALGERFTWKYRGQVIPTDKEVLTELSVRVGTDGADVLAIASGSLWNGDKRIYEVDNLAVRITSGESLTELPKGSLEDQIACANQQGG